MEKLREVLTGWAIAAARQKTSNGRLRSPLPGETDRLLLHDAADSQNQTHCWKETMQLMTNIESCSKAANLQGETF